MNKPTNAVILYAVPSKKRTLVEQTYYDRERFNRPELVEPISLERQWAQLQLNNDWSALQQHQQYQSQPSIKAQSEHGVGMQSFTSRPKPFQCSLQTGNTAANRFGTQNGGPAFDPPMLRTSASLGNLHHASRPRSPLLSQTTQHRLQQPNKANSVVLAQDVNSINYLQQEEEDDLDKLIKKIEQDAIIQDELGK